MVFFNTQSANRNPKPVLTVSHAQLRAAGPRNTWGTKHELPSIAEECINEIRNSRRPQTRGRGEVTSSGDPFLPLLRIRGCSSSHSRHVKLARRLDAREQFLGPRGRRQRLLVDLVLHRRAAVQLRLRPACDRTQKAREEM
jgi:hypothetical protein